MLKPQQQPGSGGRKTSNGTSGPGGMSSPVSGSRTPGGRNRPSAKPSFQSSPVFEGVYNNARMLHFLTAVVGSTCDIRVKNGNVFEGIFKTLSSRCELAVDAVHKRSEEEGSTSVPPRREDITDTMIFSPSDLVTMICRDVDLSFATRDSFTDTAISSSRINGEHKEKVLQKWEGGDSNGESYDLDNDASNGWDANEMFRFNEVKYGVTSTYDSSLSMYTVPLERGTSEVFRQREARAARLANEIESSPQYRRRASLENDEGKSEEDKYSSVLRDGSDRERDHESPRERGRDSPGASSREGKYIPLPQRQREMNRERAERGPGGPPPHNRLSGGYRPSTSSSSSPRPPLSSAGGPQPGVSPSERSSPLSSRSGAYAPHHPQGSHSPGSGAASPYTPASPGGPTSTPASASNATSPSSPPAPHGHAVPHSHSLPLSLSDAGRPINGVSTRTSPKAQRPPQSSRTNRNTNFHSQPTAIRSPKSGSSHDTPYLDTSSVSLPAQKTSGPAPLFPVDVNEILGAAAKERSAESPSSTEDSKSSKAPSVQQRSQIEELRKFGKEFRLQPSAGSSSSPTSPAAATPPSVGEVTQQSATKPPSSDAHPASEAKPQPPAASPSQPQHSPAPTEEPIKDTTTTLGSAAATNTTPISDRQSPATPEI
ncbi:ataxin-2-like protein, partial [Austrofundulus limnaeus]|uniref:Ataxin-2-like protein n=1 Tax=Austrofundulus limnaeus TaxID=52670 RepID=A0A2I4CWS9_AUSLI